MEPAPSMASSSRSSTSSRVIGLPPEVSGLTAPSAVRPLSSRLNQMLNQAVKRCQATPIVRLVEMTISQIIAEVIFTIAMKKMMFSSVPIESWPVGKRLAKNCETGKWKPSACSAASPPWALARLYSAPRMKRIAELSRSTMASTK